MSDLLAVRDLDVDLGGRTVLRGVDVSVAPGELVAVLGSNGSGKSTLIRAALGLVPTRSGTVELFGDPLDRFRDRHRLGYVPQRAASQSGVPATVREVIRSGLLARHRRAGFPTRAERAAVEEAAALVGLSDRLGSRVTELSGGQHQRVLIARALAVRPDLLVLDEPTAGVDHDHTVLLGQVLESVLLRGGGVLLVEHELGPIRPIVTRVVVLDDGQVVHTGPASGISPSAIPHHHPHDEMPRLEPLPGEGVVG